MKTPFWVYLSLFPKYSACWLPGRSQKGKISLQPPGPPPQIGPHAPSQYPLSVCLWTSNRGQSRCQVAFFFCAAFQACSNALFHDGLACVPIRESRKAEFPLPKMQLHSSSGVTHHHAPACRYCTSWATGRGRSLWCTRPSWPVAQRAPTVHFPCYHMRSRTTTISTCPPWRAPCLAHRSLWLTYDSRSAMSAPAYLGQQQERLLVPASWLSNQEAMCQRQPKLSSAGWENKEDNTECE